jgi:hypothetical protein
MQPLTHNKWERVNERKKAVAVIVIIIVDLAYSYSNILIPAHADKEDRAAATSFQKKRNSRVILYSTTIEFIDIMMLKLCYAV